MSGERKYEPLIYSLDLPEKKTKSGRQFILNFHSLCFLSFFEAAAQHTTYQCTIQRAIYRIRSNSAGTTDTANVIPIEIPANQPKYKT